MTTSSTVFPSVLNSNGTADGSRRAPCLGLALVAAGLLWAGLGSTVAILLA